MLAWFELTAPLFEYVSLRVVGAARHQLCADGAIDAAAYFLAETKENG